MIVVRVCPFFCSAVRALESACFFFSESSGHFANANAQLAHKLSRSGRAGDDRAFCVRSCQCVEIQSLSEKRERAMSDSWKMPNAAALQSNILKFAERRLSG